MKKTYVAGAVAGILAVGLLSPGSASATAGYLGTYNATSVKIRSTPRLNSPQVYGLGYPGQKVCVFTDVHGDTYSPGLSTWDYGRNITTGVHAGYSGSIYISYYSNPNPNAQPDCVG